jgi:hypothetical protein
MKHLLERIANRAELVRGARISQFAQNAADYNGCKRSSVLGSMERQGKAFPTLGLRVRSGKDERRRSGVVQDHAGQRLAVCEGMESLRRCSCESVHRYFLQSRRKWFDRVAGRQVVLWWAPRGALPTLEEAKAKLRLLEAAGPSPAAFTFQHAFDSLGQPWPRIAKADWTDTADSND